MKTESSVGDPTGIRDQTPRHTPGPWTLDSAFPDIDGYKVRGGTLVFRKGPRLIAVVKNQGDSPIAEDHLSDARLIAAAPDLLSALKKMRAWIGGMSFTPPSLVAECDALIEQAQAAIAKAEGK
jgi:hypothetical protein